MRLYLANLDASHAPAADDPSACLCGDAQTDGRDRHLLEIITEHFVAPAPDGQGAPRSAMP
jgi:hypothetical protein